MYNLNQKQLAVETYLEIGSLRKTIQCLGYPGSRVTLKQWIDEFNTLGFVKESKRQHHPAICFYRLPGG